MESPSAAADQDVLQAYRAKLNAMTGGDTAALQELLADGFTLTHITGYTQLKTAWLSGMDGGQFHYHHIDENTTCRSASTATPPC